MRFPRYGGKPIELRISFFVKLSPLRRMEISPRIHDDFLRDFISLYLSYYLPGTGKLNRDKFNLFVRTLEIVAREICDSFRFVAILIFMLQQFFIFY